MLPKDYERNMDRLRQLFGGIKPHIIYIAGPSIDSSNVVENIVDPIMTIMVGRFDEQGDPPQRRLNILADLSSVKGMTGAGIRGLVMLQKEAGRFRTGQIVLGDMDDGLMRQIEKTGLLSSFRWFPDSK